MNNGRVKAIEVEVELPWSEGDPPNPRSACRPSTIRRGWQLNCLISQDWREWVRCPKRQVAVGLKAYFEREEATRAA